MQKITTSEDLKNAIQQLEYTKATQWPLLKEELYTTYENLKPINLIKNTIKDVITAPDLKANVANTVIGLATGFVAKKAFVGGSHNPLTKLFGIILETFVANKAASNADKIKSTVMHLANTIFNKKDSTK